MTLKNCAVAFAVAVAAGSIFSVGAAAQLAGAQRAGFIEGSIRGCTKTAQANHPEISAATITTYCTCMANGEADITTQADLDYINEHKAPTDTYKQRVLALAPACNTQAGLH